MKTATNQPITEHAVEFSHQVQSRPDIPEGTPLRKLLRLLRSASYGNIGEMHGVELSDGTSISVELQDGRDGSQLMNSQRIVRRDNAQRIIRTYPLR